jgi:hypothetical protein
VVLALHQWLHDLQVESSGFKGISDQQPLSDEIV